MFAEVHVFQVRNNFFSPAIQSLLAKCLLDFTGCIVFNKHVSEYPNHDGSLFIRTKPSEHSTVSCGIKPDLRL